MYMTPYERCYIELYDTYQYITQLLPLPPWLNQQSYTHISTLREIALKTGSKGPHIWWESESEITGFRAVKNEENDDINIMEENNDIRYYYPYISELGFMLIFSHKLLRKLIRHVISTLLTTNITNTQQVLTYIFNNNINTIKNKAVYTIYQPPYTYTISEGNHTSQLNIVSFMELWHWFESKIPLQSALSGKDSTVQGSIYSKISMKVSVKSLTSSLYLRSGKVGTNSVYSQRDSAYGAQDEVDDDDDDDGDDDDDDDDEGEGGDDKSSVYTSNTKGRLSTRNSSYLLPSTYAPSSTSVLATNGHNYDPFSALPSATSSPTTGAGAVSAAASSKVVHKVSFCFSDLITPKDRAYLNLYRRWGRKVGMYTSEGEGHNYGD